MAPRINQLSPHTHSGEREPLSWQHVTSALQMHLAISNKCILNQDLLMSCVGGPQQKPLMWLVTESSATQNNTYYIFEYVLMHSCVHLCNVAAGNYGVHFNLFIYILYIALHTG